MGKVRKHKREYEPGKFTTVKEHYRQENSDKKIKSDIEQDLEEANWQLWKEHELEKAAKGHAKNLRKRGAKVKRRGTKVFVKFD
ncbi:MAG: hypothetical protein ACOC4M_04555 [Promethearchaeia archaeon]